LFLEVILFFIFLNYNIYMVLKNKQRYFCQDLIYDVFQHGPEKRYPKTILHQRIKQFAF